MKARRPYAPKNHRSPRPEDLQEKSCITAGVDEAIAVMKPWVRANPAKLLASLTRPELESIVYAALGAWIVKRSEIEAAETLNDPIDDLWRMA